ncbi:hypothetical protein SNE40_011862 [Patella caerulea]|uniref:Endothelin-converting enzyme 1 n=1 Tax=Patella caerulea TaxID=87958 RepID=A0AAN8JP75_PATCE
MHHRKCIRGVKYWSATMASKYVATDVESTTGSKNALYADRTPPETIRFEERGWCGRRSAIEKILMVLIFLAFATIIGLAVAIFLNVKHPSNSQVSDVKTPQTGQGKLESSLEDLCVTPDCVRVAARISDAIDTTIHPCDDFYMYACGNWKRKNVIPDDATSYGTLVKVAEDVRVILKGLLEMPVKSSDLEPIVKAKTLYTSCLNATNIEALGSQPLLDFIRNLGVWPVLSSTWTPAGYNLRSILDRMDEYGSGPLFGVAILGDLKQSTKNILYLDQPSLGMPGQKYYQRGRNDTMVEAYETFAVKLTMALGADEATAKQDMKDMVDFEFRLANISVPAEQRRDTEKNYNKMTIKEMASNYPGFDWLLHLQNVFSLPNINIRITEDEEIVNYSPPYFEKLLPLLNETPPRTVANYVFWKTVKSYIGYLSKQFTDMGVEYVKALFGTQSDTARWKTCVGDAGSMLGNAVGREFIRTSFDEEAKADMLTMISNLKTSFDALLDSNDWMDDVTRKLAKEKSDVMGIKIGYDDKLLNNSYLEEYYENYTYKADEYFWNKLRYDMEESAKASRLLRKPVDKKEWARTPAVVNAYYSPQNNEIAFPAGILQPPLYHKNFPQAVNYGGIGTVIGHEITHGFDDRGRQFDKTGNLRQWWTDGIIKKFQEKAQCLVNQYGNYTVPGADMQINGINTQGENIADNGGLKESFQAYRNWVKQNGKEERMLPGLDFTPNQLFFVNYAQSWCSNMRQQSSINQILTGTHSPDQFRIIGPLQNSPDFAEAFNCPTSSYMNPAKKCNVW